MENRESFFGRLEPFMIPSELRNIQVAYMMAKFAHRAQVRTETDANGDPVRYFEHLRRVALILIDEYDVRRWELVCAALLHDSLEDTNDITAPIIEHLFGGRVCQIVKILSKTPKQGYYERLRRFGDHDILLVKGADRLDNLRSLGQATREFADKQRRETQEVVLPIMRLFLGSNHSLVTDVNRLSLYKG